MKPCIAAPGGCLTGEPKQAVNQQWKGELQHTVNAFEIATAIISHSVVGSMMPVAWVTDDGGTSGEIRKHSLTSIKRVYGISMVY